MLCPCSNRSCFYSALGTRAPCRGSGISKHRLIDKGEIEREISFEGDALGISKLIQVLSSQYLVVGPQKRCSRESQGDFDCCWLEIPYRLKHNRRFEL